MLARHLQTTRIRTALHNESKTKKQPSSASSGATNHRGEIMNNQLKSAVYGLAVADALGVPGEFRRRGTYRIDGMVGGGAHDQPAGTFSDDTSMALACCDSLRCNQGLVDTEDMRARFRAWRDTGRYAVAGRVFDIGITVSNALSRGRGGRARGYRLRLRRDSLRMDRRPTRARDHRRVSVVGRQGGSIPSCAEPPCGPKRRG